MKIISFNVNSVRMRLPAIAQLIKEHNPDIIGLQETKVQDCDYPITEIKNMGYKSFFTGQKTHYGVAILCKKEPISVQLNFPFDSENAQKRLVCADFIFNNKKLRVINGYFPQGESDSHPQKYPAKKKFYANLIRFLDAEYKKNEHIIVIGDFNIAEQDIDVGIGETNAKRWLKTGKCAFLPEEREWFANLKNWGFIDSFRYLYPTQRQYSWFDYRSRGFEDDPKRGLRIDYILVSKNMLTSLTNSGICYNIRAGKKPSDHAPVYSEFSL
jgi:exodeoxyribonuclease III